MTPLFVSNSAVGLTFIRAKRRYTYLIYDPLFASNSAVGLTFIRAKQCYTYLIYDPSVCE